MKFIFATMLVIIIHNTMAIAAPGGGPIIHKAETPGVPFNIHNGK